MAVNYDQSSPVRTISMITTIKLMKENTNAKLERHNHKFNNKGKEVTLLDTLFSGSKPPYLKRQTFYVTTNKKTGERIRAWNKKEAMFDYYRTASC